MTGIPTEGRVVERNWVWDRNTLGRLIERLYGANIRIGMSGVVNPALVLPFPVPHLLLQGFRSY
jgi:hypothetical protein